MLQFDRIKRKDVEDSFLLVVLVVCALHLCATLLFLHFKSATSKQTIAAAAKPLRVRYIEEKKPPLAVRSVEHNSIEANADKRKKESVAQVNPVSAAKQEVNFQSVKFAVKEEAASRNLKEAMKAKKEEVAKHIAMKPSAQQETKSQQETKRRGRMAAFEALQQMNHGGSLAVLEPVDLEALNLGAKQIRLISEDEGASASTEGASALSAVAEQLRSMLVLPQYGLVRVKIAISAAGKISNVKVLESHNKLNERYVVEMLSQKRLTVALPAEEMELELILSNQ